jgi:hypothetical protein
MGGEPRSAVRDGRSVASVTDEEMLDGTLVDEGGAAGEGGGELAGTAGDGLEKGDGGPDWRPGRLRAAQEAVDGEEFERAVQGVEGGQRPGECGKGGDGAG